MTVPSPRPSGAALPPRDPTETTPTPSAPPPDLAAGPDPGLPSDGMPTHILVVDDSALDRKLVEDQLQATGYRVTTAADGGEALRAIETQAPDLILLDVIMPGMDGYELCRRVKADPRTILIPVVMITSLQATEERIKGIEAGADEFLSKPFNPQELLTRARSLLKLKRHTDELENAETVLFTLALSVEAKDPYTNGHCDRLARYSVALGRKLGLSPELLKALHRGGILHDVGKIGVPDAILLKPGPLTKVERSVMQTHPIVGERICAPLKSLRLVLPIIRHHHERWDGTGYPDGLAGEQIPLTARVLQVVDLYDAFTTQRPYKPAYTPETACRIMREEAANGWWDGPLIERFIALLHDEGFVS
jgi:putative two-component system response regulator